MATNSSEEAYGNSTAAHIYRKWWWITHKALFVAQKHTYWFMLVHVHTHTHKHAHLKGKLHMVLICGGVRRGSVWGDRLVVLGVVLVLARRGTGSVFTYIHKQWLGVGGWGGVQVGPRGCPSWDPARFPACLIFLVTSPVFLHPGERRDGGR